MGTFSHTIVIFGFEFGTIPILWTQIQIDNKKLKQT